MTSKAINRLNRELKDLNAAPLEWAAIEIINNNIFFWKIVMDGPEDTPYAGGKFTIEVDVPPEYPFKSPKARFITKIYHPNILQKTGEICEQILGDNWCPQTKLSDILLILREMLRNPSLESPLEQEVAEQYSTKKNMFDKVAKEWTKKYAK